MNLPVAIRCVDQWNQIKWMDNILSHGKYVTNLAHSNYNLGRIYVYSIHHLLITLPKATKKLYTSEATT